jgi:hypothetical protein
VDLDLLTDTLSYIQKRLAEKAAKQSAKKAGGSTDAGSETPTGSGSVKGDSTTGTPLTNRSAAGSQEDLMSMEKLKIATDRYVFGMYILGPSSGILHRGSDFRIPPSYPPSSHSQKSNSTFRTHAQRSSSPSRPIGEKISSC